MRYLSFCDGLGAVHLAFRSLGWQCLAVAETDPACCRVVGEHWGFPNLGDVNSLLGLNNRRALHYGKPDIVIGGTPCQAFSFIGQRAGLRSPQGSVTKTFFQLVGEIRPLWVVWENVTGVLSSDDGKDFAFLLDTLERFGYGWAYRTLDAQFFGVPQQRRRVYLVGYLGDFAPAAEVLFDPESVPRRSASDCENAGSPDTGETIVRRCLSREGRFEQRVSVPVAHTLRTGTTSQLSSDNFVLENAVADKDNPARVRRLTPLECERLQGLPDNYTNVSYHNRPMADYHRYRMIGNAMTVPVVAAVGKSLQRVHRYLYGV